MSCHTVISHTWCHAINNFWNPKNSESLIYNAIEIKHPIWNINSQSICHLEYQMRSINYSLSNNSLN